MLLTEKALEEKREELEKLNNTLKEIRREICFMIISDLNKQKFKKEEF